MGLRAWPVLRYVIVALFGSMIMVLIINGVFLLDAQYVWLAISQIAAILVLVGVILFLYQRIWLEIRRRLILRDLGNTLTDPGNSNEFLDQVVRASLQLFPMSDRCAIHLLDEIEQKLRLASSSAPKLEGLDLLPASQGLLGEVLRDLKPQLVPDTRQVTGPLPIDPGAGRGSLIVVPLQARGKPMGLLSLYSHITGIFAPQDRLLLSLLGTLASAALDRARLASVALGEMGLVDNLVEGLCDGLAILDQENRVLYYNASLAPFLGAHITELAGQKVDMESENAAARRLAALLGSALSNGDTYQEFPAQLDDPFHCSFRIYVSPLLDQDKQWKRIVVLHDQTAEADRARIQSELMAATLQESSPALRSIRSYAALLEDEEQVGAPTMPWAGLVRDQSVRLMRLVHGLQDVSAMQEQTPSLNQEVTPLWPLVKNVLAELAEPAQRAGVSLDLHLPADLSNILCDPDRLRDTLFYVVDNAVRRGVSGGHIHLEILIHCTHLLFSVTDNGHPIPAGTWDRIQRGLNPSKASLSEDPYDTGLGLYLGRKLVEAHGGHLWLGPPAEHGAALYFVVPYQPVIL